MATDLNVMEFHAMIDQSRYFQDFGTRLSLLRKEAGLTQEQLGKSVGLSQQMIADYESGTRKHIPLCRIIDLAEVLGVDVSVLLNSDNDNQRKRGPAPKVQQLVERIYRLPRPRQKFVEEMLENALQAK